MESTSRNDTKPIFIRRLWLRELAALAQGRPLTDWQVPPAPLGRT